jgi:mycothiol synthase
MLDMLPDGLTSRPLAMADAGAVFRLMAADELVSLGEVSIEEADIVSDWQRPSFDIGASTVGVFEGDELIGYAEVGPAGRGDACVHPQQLGRGIGTHLARWMQDKAREQGQSVIGMPVPAGSPGERLMRDLGYRVRWNSWVLQLPQGASIPDRPLPDGFAIREGGPEDYQAVWTMVEDAFLEWSVRERQTFEDFAATIYQRPGFEPWNMRVLIDDEGEIVGTSIVSMNPPTAYVSRLAVRRDLRGRGLAQALLADSFAVGREHGATVSELSTDSRTGALSLYEKVGMEVTSNWVNLGIDL